MMIWVALNWSGTRERAMCSPANAKEEVRVGHR
jgi:hypothetical protein